MIPSQVEDLQRLFLERARYFHTVPELLEIVHAIVTEQHTYRRSLVLTELVSLFKLVYVEREEASDHDIAPTFEGLSDVEVAHILLQVQRSLQEKILVTYLAKGKVSRREAEGMFLALCDMMKDWTSDGSTTSLFWYAHRHLGVSEEEYHNTLRTKMEYLLREVRSELAARLRAEL